MIHYDCESFELDNGCSKYCSNYLVAGKCRIIDEAFEVVKDESKKQSEESYERAMGIL